jgi:ATP-binding protein involved in chromosome partitioning
VEIAFDIFLILVAVRFSGRSSGSAARTKPIAADLPALQPVKNISYFLCPSCGTRSDIFGHGGARHEAERLGVEFLGEVPPYMAIREKYDAGLPVVANPTASARIYRSMRSKCLPNSRAGAAGRAAPKIVIKA